MITKTSKNEIRQRVHDRIRKKMLGTPERPRLNVYRSLNHIYVQIVDDLHGRTLVAASTNTGKKGGRTTGGNVASAKDVGKQVAEAAKSKGITKVSVWLPKLRVMAKPSSVTSRFSYQCCTTTVISAG